MASLRCVGDIQVGECPASRWTGMSGAQKEGGAGNTHRGITFMAFKAVEVDGVSWGTDKRVKDSVLRHLNT